MNLNAKYLREQYVLLCMTKCREDIEGNTDFFISKAPGRTRGRARFKHGGNVGAP